LNPKKKKVGERARIKKGYFKEKKPTSEIKNEWGKTWEKLDEGPTLRHKAHKKRRGGEKLGGSRKEKEDLKVSLCCKGRGNGTYLRKNLKTSRGRKNAKGKKPPNNCPYKEKKGTLIAQEAGRGGRGVGNARTKEGVIISGGGRALSGVFD